MIRAVIGTVLLSCVLAGAAAPATKPVVPPGPGDAMIKAALAGEVAAIARNCQTDLAAITDWPAAKAQLRRELAEMLGLWPAPAKTDLKATITGKVDHPLFTVENLHFQSRPGLYVTANLYIPKNLKERAPAILYVCGHGNIKKNGISYGAKAYYQYWPAWFARNGYVCLIIDTLQLGEIEGLHHGTYREKMWWWHDRGYTPAGVECWNAIRSLDYLCSRPEVDPDRLGVTGRSGGGAYSWWLTAMDDRIKVAIPTAGITDLQNHVVDNCVEGHCDCMFMANTYRWDYAKVAALAAPRPLLLSNTDKDTIFPLDGVYRIHQQIHGVYELTKAALKNLGLLITEGPHKDTQDLQVPALRWFNRHFKGIEDPIPMLAEKFFEPEQLRVFKQIPADQINTRIQEQFVAVAGPPAVPETLAQWQEMQRAWMKNLREQSFRGWPASVCELNLKKGESATSGGLTLTRYEFTSQDAIRLDFIVVAPEKLERPQVVTLKVLDEKSWEDFRSYYGRVFPKIVGFAPEVDMGTMAQDDRNRLLAAKDAGVTKSSEAIVYFAPRGIGPTGLSLDERKRTHILRRFYLVGQTLDAMRVWDTRQAMAAIGSIEPLKAASIRLWGTGQSAGLALYASLFENVGSLELMGLPPTHMEGPHFLNVLRFMDMPAALAMANQRADIVLRGTPGQVAQYAQEVQKKHHSGKGMLITEPR